MKKQLLILPSIFFLLILLILFYLLIIDRNPIELPSTLINKNVPKFETESLLKEKKFVSSDVFGKKIKLVNFFATWCKPCRDEHNYIKRFSNQDGIGVIGINFFLDRAPNLLNLQVSSNGPGQFLKSLAASFL